MEDFKEEFENGINPDANPLISGGNEEFIEALIEKICSQESTEEKQIGQDNLNHY
jgi:2-hydroxy-3-keto-5-methylthiopentenyl-1-phosphate phosphatase